MAYSSQCPLFAPVGGLEGQIAVFGVSLAMNMLLALASPGFPGNSARSPHLLLVRRVWLCLSFTQLP
jgi:hypothetical protein